MYLPVWHKYSNDEKLIEQSIVRMYRPRPKKPAKEWMPARWTVLRSSIVFNNSRNALYEFLLPLSVDFAVSNYRKLKGQQ